jgi:hypothetical protein
MSAPSAQLNSAKRWHASSRKSRWNLSLLGLHPDQIPASHAELFQLMQKRAADFGFRFDNLSYDWSKIVSRSRSVADKVAGGVEFLFKKIKSLTCVAKRVSPLLEKLPTRVATEKKRSLRPITSLSLPEPLPGTCPGYLPRAKA